jgi:hypothetical protein
MEQNNKRDGKHEFLAQVHAQKSNALDEQIVTDERLF